MDEAKNVGTKEEIFLNIFQTERVKFRTQIVAGVIKDDSRSVLSFYASLTIKTKRS